uniref:Uncharacterized protein n=1 Tax=Anguilla anguilla TaxID=7936 RepID=A0A0E9R2J7_ANGAN
MDQSSHSTCWTQRGTAASLFIARKSPFFFNLIILLMLKFK